MSRRGAIPIWSFVLARSSDKSTIVPIGAASVRGLSMFYNRPGSFNATVPIDSDVAMKVGELSTCIIATVRLFNDDGSDYDRIEAWSGPVFNIVEGVPEDTVQITALGWLQELEARDLDSQFTATSQIGGSIGLDLLNRANTKTDSLGRPQPTHVLPGEFADTQVRTRTYQRGQSIGAAIRELSEVENGYDYSVDSATRQLSFKPPTAFADKKKVRFGYRLPPFNVASLTRTSDAMKTRNKISVQGSTGIAIQDDPAAMDVTGLMMEDYISVSDVPNLDTLNAYAGAELAFSALPEQVLTLKPTRPSEEGAKVPIFLRDFNLGDQGYLSADRGRLQLANQACRFFGVSLSFDQEGNQNTESFDINYSSGG